MRRFIFIFGLLFALYCLLFISGCSLFQPPEQASQQPQAQPLAGADSIVTITFTPTIEINTTNTATSDQTLNNTNDLTNNTTTNPTLNNTDTTTLNFTNNFSEEKGGK